MSEDEITQAQAVIREFGYDTQDHCRSAADACIRLGMMAEASEVIRASKRLIDLLVAISGKDFLFIAEQPDEAASGG
jgi:hypothetical protein